VPNKLKNLQVTRVALVDAAANPDADILIYKSQHEGHEPKNQPKEAAPVADEITKADLDAVTAERDALQAEIDALAALTDDDLAALRGFTIAKADDIEEQINKSDLPEAVRKALDEAEVMKADIEKMKAEARKAEFVKKAADEYGVSDDEFAASLEEADRVLSDAAKKSLDRTLKALAAQVDTSVLFGEAGRSEGASGTEMLNVRAAEIEKAENIDHATALQRAMAENPEAQAAAFSRK